MTQRWHALMARALELAARAGPTVLPNPRVGALVVKGSTIIADGYHRRCGGAHAERFALKKAGDRAKRATLIVTLEPCSHHGRTPPCTDAILASGIRRVVYAASDPNPEVRGRRQLSKAGLEVIGGVMSAEARALNPGFFRQQKTGLPHLHMKVATSLDGFMCLPDGTSQWLTGVQARREGHKLRGRAAAILTGIGTVLHDNPQLTVRHGPRRRPARVIIDSQARTPPAANIFKGEGSVHVLCTENAPIRRRNRLSRAGATVHMVAAEESGQIDLIEALSACAELGLTEIHVEAGPTLSGALLRAQLVGELSWFQAPILLGEGRSPGPLGVKDPQNALRLRQLRTQSLGSDLLHHGFLPVVDGPLL